MKLLKCLLALLLVPLPVFAAASFDVANASYSANYGNTSITFNGTVGATDNFLVVIVNNDYVGTIGDPTPITFNGTAITKLNEQGCNTYFYQYVYYMVNPPTGTHSLTMNFNGTYNTSVLFCL